MANKLGSLGGEEVPSAHRLQPKPFAGWLGRRAIEEHVVLDPMPPNT
jgi:hypothetical protein